MEEKQDPIVNVGIKQTQKEKVSELISKNYAYKSINEFVQNATSKLLDAETKKTATNSSSMESVLGELQEFNITLLKEEPEKRFAGVVAVLNSRSLLNWITALGILIA